MPTRIDPSLRTLAACCAIAGLAAGASGAAATPRSSEAPAGAPIGQAARSCPPGSYPGSGYFTSLSVSGTGCPTGRRLEVSYYRCRTRHGVRGRCRGGVLGFSCRETRRSIATEIDARVTCHKGRARIVHTYQQNT